MGLSVCQQCYLHKDATPHAVGGFHGNDTKLVFHCNAVNPDICTPSAPEFVKAGIHYPVGDKDRSCLVSWWTINGLHTTVSKTS